MRLSLFYTVRQNRKPLEKLKSHPTPLGRLLPLLVLVLILAPFPAQTHGIFRTIIGKLVPLEVLDKLVPR